ncbi:hypothetical protein [Streptomyces sp. NPDC002187]|uniref:hypothetical protein n=1 Tax=Streptomyces sp. NPDC002187 TaxID=3364637 RepID=UPI0036C06943
MSQTAGELLAALEPLPFPERLRHMARTARSLSGAELTSLLEELDRRGPYERRLAALAALAGGQAGFLAARLTDPDRVVSGYALRAARTLPLADEAIEAAYAGASAATRNRLAGVVLAGRRTALAERLVVRLREEWGDGEATRLLAACSAGFVAALLPELAHAFGSWTRFARVHPDLLLDHAERELAGQGQQHLRAKWWERNASGVAAAAAARPERVLTLLERHGPATLPWQLCDRLGLLVTADAERVVRWIVSPDRGQQRHERLPAPGVLRKLVQADPPSLPVLGRHWRNRQHLTGLLKAMPPSRRGDFFDTAMDGMADHHPADDVLKLLPRERRWAEVRYWVAKGPAEGWDWHEVLDTLAHGPLDEARPELLTALKRSDPDDRALVWPLLVACTGRSGERSAMADLLTLMQRLRNEQDPVRSAALGALADLHPALFTPQDVAALDRILLDALEARDSSTATRDALRRLAVGLLVESATETTGGTDGAGVGAEGESTLLGWALRALERITAHVGVTDFGPLHRTLRRGQEQQVFEVLRPWLEAACDKADHRLLFALTTALGHRARRMPELQRMLEDALAYGSDHTFSTAAGLWLDAPATRDERAARILELESSAAVLAPVQQVLTRRRTDLLDVLLGDEPPYGRFLVPGSRRPLPLLGDAGRWLPRQQDAAIRLAAAAVADETRPAYDRARVFLEAARVPVHGRRLALEHAEAPEVVIAEAALGALPWTDLPEETLPVLLAHAGGDRARVAVYAATRVARFASPSELGVRLGGLLTSAQGVKVTSRKEAVRLAARFLPVRQAAALLAAAYRAPDQHPDVQAAIVSVAAGLLGAPEMWDVLGEAPHGAPQVQHALVGISPWELPEAHRPRYARLVGDTCRSAHPEVRYPALNALPKWAGYAPEVASLLGRAVTDLNERTNWRQASWALVELATSGLPHPVGGAAGGSLFHTTVAELLTAMRRGEYEALANRDLPARQRLLYLVTGLPDTPQDASGRRVKESLAQQLADDPSLVEAHAGVLRMLVDVHADLPELMARLRALADAVDGRRVLAADMGRQLATRGYVHGRAPERPETALAAARRLAADGSVATGMLALGLVSRLGPRLGWPEEWRTLLRQLRRHADMDVRHSAYAETTHHE